MDFKTMLKNARDKITIFRGKHPHGIVIIYGPTSTGKTKLSIQLSEFFDTEIISADSRQIYRTMDIGTDKIPNKYLEKIPHHQINIIDPNEQYSAGERQMDTKRHIQNIQKKNKLASIVGGTGLYIDTIYKNFTLPRIPANLTLRKELQEKEEKTPGFLYQELSRIDPQEAKKNHPNSTRYLIRALEIYHESGKTKTETFKEQDVDNPILMIGIQRDVEMTKQLIATRIEEMIAQGLIQEVEQLLKKGYQPDLQSMQGIGYKEVIGYLQGEYDKETMKSILNRNTCHLAKKQRTWFRRYENDAINKPKKNVEYLSFKIE